MPVVVVVVGSDVVFGIVDVGTDDGTVEIETVVVEADPKDWAAGAEVNLFARSKDPATRHPTTTDPAKMARRLFRLLAAARAARERTGRPRDPFANPSS